MIVFLNEGKRTMSQNLPIYQFITDDHTSVPFRLYELKPRTQMARFRPHRHNFFELFFFIKGAGYHLIDFERFDIHSGSVHFVAPGQVHLVQRELDTTGYTILFSRDFFHLHLENKDHLMQYPFFNQTRRQVLNLEPVMASALEGIFKLIVQEYAQEKKQDDVLRSLLHLFLLKCRQFYTEQPSVAQRLAKEQGAWKLIYEFKKLVNQKFTEIHQVGEYAQLLSVSPNHLNNSTKQIVGQTASELIQSRIVLEAKRLLMHSAMSNKEIAYALNFNDPAYFSRFFRKHLQMSPSEFKKNIYEKYQH